MRPTLLPAIGGGFASLWQTFTATGSITIPNGATRADIYAIGGGQGGEGELEKGGTGACCVGEVDISLAGHSALYVSIGAGGSGGTPGGGSGGDTIVRFDSSGGTMILRAPGGGSINGEYPDGADINYLGGEGGSNRTYAGGGGGSAGNTTDGGNPGNYEVGGAANTNGLLTCGKGGDGGENRAGWQGDNYGSGGGGGDDGYSGAAGRAGMLGIYWKDATGNYLPGGEPSGS